MSWVIKSAKNSVTFVCPSTIKVDVSLNDIESTPEIERLKAQDLPADQKAKLASDSAFTILQSAAFQKLVGIRDYSASQGISIESAVPATIDEGGEIDWLSYFKRFEGKPKATAPQGENTNESEEVPA